VRAIVNAIRIKTIVAAATGNDRLAMRRIQDDGGGGVTVGPEHFVTGQVEAAIPSVAVTSDGTVGVFYYTFDGFSQDNLPIFSAHLAQSSDQGVTFSYQTLLNFLSSAADNGNSRQRGLGDYMQIKAVDDVSMVPSREMASLWSTFCQPRPNLLQSLRRCTTKAHSNAKVPPGVSAASNAAALRKVTYTLTATGSVKDIL
jgi:hypothetical protein